MTTVMFVHGTGVRAAAYATLLRRIRDELSRLRPAVRVVPCFWGGEHGSVLHAGGVSIPSGYTGRAIEAAYDMADEIENDRVTENDRIALWAVLEQDPLCELRLLATAMPEPTERPPWSEPPGKLLADQVEALPRNGTLARLLGETSSQDAFEAAVITVLDSEAGKALLVHEAALGGEARRALARALVATVLVSRDAELAMPLLLDGAHRDQLVAQIVAQLGGSDRGLGAAAARASLKLALRLGATRPIERRRAAITEAASPLAGDVMLYLARGQGIRDFIAREVAAAEGPVVCLAHSLGGIAAVDLLVSRHLPAMQLLITVGSQAPYLYELNALPTLEFGQALPASVPPWVNIYDPRDLLGYVGEGVFPGRVQDRVVDNGVPFPRSHSAYFGNDAFYAIVNEVLPCP
ncbi:MAG: hypothetical protein ACRDTT_07395 [Pseudonocardiaceae bacterium]